MSVHVLVKYLPALSGRGGGGRYWEAAGQRLEHQSDKRQEEKDGTRGN